MDKYAVIGNPVEHSLSPVIFQAFEKQTNHSFDYLKIKAPVNGFAAAVKKFHDKGGKGANITLPFKEEAYQLADKRSQEANEAHAASALQFREDGTIYAVNYDGLGLVQDLTRNHNITLTQKSILIVGAGGATRGILGPLLNAAPEKIVIVNRTPSKAHALAKIFHLRGEIQGGGFDELEPMRYDVIIHATSLGHQGKFPPLPDGLIGSQSCCYDLSYGKIASPFLQWAKDQGAKYNFDGLGMLVEHNAAVFYLWFGIYPDTNPVIEMLQAHL
ncbi:shikimate dehydrogenase [Coxiella burnetii]|uniref:Shikimate dehydrogenase (NADP(+)) n=1 Tax=Coxiella burnetii (strain Dugway 5J108-111) TaxID=434922 RepID=AROE_COXBN|nr:shikimate dehydrogenase [Coxiella burnetii]A9KBC1.1 RecName: Full=Shikimate dehydrogenase (NADP(+)); Short=SDH [Coxiella burnetii Dugway 5J108-111]ABS77362.1 shikimate 5-dehydrogenase [Coxiella burnetii Dugway 5J108-111]OYK81191.1 shikimate dehydrogenase [Coxiella burnetii]OYK83281.1 shikimate dehydrogenase [Coxiella burnetii]